MTRSFPAHAPNYLRNRSRLVMCHQMYHFSIVASYQGELQLKY